MANQTSMNANLLNQLVRILNQISSSTSGQQSLLGLLGLGGSSGTAGNLGTNTRASGNAPTRDIMSLLSNQLTMPASQIFPSSIFNWRPTSLPSTMGGGNIGFGGPSTIGYGNDNIWMPAGSTNYGFGGGQGGFGGGSGTLAGIPASIFGTLGTNAAAPGAAPIMDANALLARFNQQFPQGLSNPFSSSILNWRPTGLPSSMGGGNIGSGGQGFSNP